MTKHRTPVFGITGWKNSGKTTLTVSLIAEFTRRGYRVSSIKHAHHSFDVDTPGTDSFRHRENGANEVAIVGEARWALLTELRDQPEPGLEDVLSRMAPCDLILIEGYKREAVPKIECRRATARKSWPVPDDTGSVLAMATDGVAETKDAGDRPVFDLDDIKTIADFIAGRLDLPRETQNRMRTPRQPHAE